MATGRTVGSKFTRVYIDGFDMSGYARSVGSLDYGFAHNEFMALEDAVMGALPGQCSISIGEITGAMDNTVTSGMHVAFSAASDAVRDVMIPLGIRAAPIAGDFTFCAQVSQNSYKANIADEVLTATIELGSWDERGDTKAYPYPWGFLIHPKGAETDVNAGSADYDHGSQTVLGGYMAYQAFTADGTVTIKLQDSPDDSAWTDLASSGVIDPSTALSAIVPLGVTTTVDRYLRWQIVLGTATTVTFALAFVRGR